MHVQFYTIFLSFLVVLTFCYAIEASSCKYGEFSRKLDDCGAEYRCLWGKKIKMKPCRESCKDIYMRQNTPSSGVYTIYPKASGPVSVFCDFYDDRGYTFVSKKDLGKLISLSELYSETDHAIVRILLRNSKQRDVSIEQLSFFKYRYPLSFQLSDSDGYKRPVNHNLGPYIYVGFLPAEYASIKSSLQGYRTAGDDVTFSNCNADPNSYLAFLANPENKPENPYYKRCCDVPRMRQWITRAQPIPEDRIMGDEFYYMYEMHMGGCGGYLTTAHTLDIISGAAVGFGFKI